MDRAVLRAGEPVRNLQHFLRRISYHYNTVSSVVPDGIFSDQTYQSVKSFQSTFGLEINGIVNNETWNKIIAVYDNIVRYYGPPMELSLIPNAQMQINAEEENDFLYAIQSLMLCISKKFSNLPCVDVCGVHNRASVEAVKKIQEICNLPSSGVIDSVTYNMIGGIYKNFVIMPHNEVKREV